ncbi:MAG: transglutaminase-like domain-containing protein [Sphingomonas sp.]
MDDIAYLGLIEDEEFELDVAALRIAALDHAGIDLAPCIDLLGAIAETLIEQAGVAHTASDQAMALATVLGGEYGFVGDRDTYDDPANADLVRVLDRRRGLPVSLSILYVAAARRIGWRADVLNTPGHVLIRVGPMPAALIVDPFDRGRIVGGVQSRAVGAPAGAMTNRAVLMRLLSNQAVRAEAAGDIARAMTVFARMTVVAPDHAAGWWERARLELALGDGTAARASLSALLEVTRDPDLRRRAAATMASLPTPR